jgi:hypothetical protein
MMLRTARTDAIDADLGVSSATRKDRLQIPTLLGADRVTFLMNEYGLDYRPIPCQLCSPVS